MDDQIFIITRYSILSKKNNAWKVGREKSFIDYKNELFSKERMDVHYNLFSQYVVPSIEKQGEHNGIKLLVFTSRDLPKHEKERLYRLAENRPWIIIVELTIEDSLNDSIRSSIRKELGASGNCLTKLPKLISRKFLKTYATVRLDDDDILSKKYIRTLRKYININFSGHTISFPRGYISRVSVPNLLINESLSVNVQKTALGLAHVSTYNVSTKKFESKFASIHEVGDHTKVDRKSAYIADYSIFAYIRTSYDQQDTRDSSFQKFSESCPYVRSKALVNEFGLSNNAFADSHDDYLKNGDANNE